jgi:hypothetical protein
LSISIYLDSSYFTKMDMAVFFRRDSPRYFLSFEIILAGICC